MGHQRPSENINNQDDLCSPANPSQSRSRGASRKAASRYENKTNESSEDESKVYQSKDTQKYDNLTN
jgi:hypothetical protein